MTMMAKNTYPARVETNDRLDLPTILKKIKPKIPKGPLAQE